MKQNLANDCFFGIRTYRYLWGRYFQGSVSPISWTVRAKRFMTDSCLFASKGASWADLSAKYSPARLLLGIVRGIL